MLASPNLTSDHHDRVSLKMDFAMRFINAFFANASYKIDPIAGDASFRKYDRLILNTFPKRNFILMDSPLIHYDLNIFILVNEFLHKNGFSVPKIYSKDLENGFLILEDFGDITIEKYLSLHALQIEESEADKIQIYSLMLDVLTKLQSIDRSNIVTFFEVSIPSYTKDASKVARKVSGEECYRTEVCEHKRIPKFEALLEVSKVYNKELLLDELSLYLKWYVPYIKGHRWSLDQEAEFRDLWQDILDLLFVNFDSSQYIVSLRDYHVQNIMFLQDRIGVQALGLLDFQDAILAHPMYDVVSLLQDARVDVPTAFAAVMIEYFLAQNSHLHEEKESMMIAYYILGAQRNMRILGVFAQKALRDEDGSYLRYMKRVNQYLSFDLNTLYTNKLKLFIERNL